MTAHISAYQTDLTPYPGQVQVTLLSPTGVMVRTWVGMQPMVCQYTLARNIPTGLWTITARTADKVGLIIRHPTIGCYLYQVQNKTFSVQYLHTQTVDISVDLPVRISHRDSTLSGTVSATYSVSGVPVRGNLTLTAHILDKGN